MATDELAIADDEKHALITSKVISSHAITKKASAVINHLRAQRADGKTAVYCFRAQSSVVNKLISIVEIAKRELLKDNTRIYQYNALCAQTITVKGRAATANDQDNAEGDSDAFQTMAEPDKTRKAPVLSVYLARASIKKLKDLYG